MGGFGADGVEQRADLVVELGRIVERGGDLFLEDRAIPLAQPVAGGVDGVLGHAEPLGQHGGPHGPFALGQDDLELVEELGPAGIGVLGGQDGHHAVEQRERPGAVEQAFRRQVVGRLDQVAALGVASVDGNRGGRDVGPVPPGVDEEGPAGDSQEGTEAALAVLDGGEDVLLEEPCEEVLGQVEGAIGVVPLAADEGIEGIPVGRAERLLGRAGLRRGRRPGLPDETPVRSGK